MSKLLIMLVLVLFLASCGANPELETTPALIAPIATRIDTAAVERGDVADARIYTGIVRQESIPLNFGAVSANFGMFYVHPGDSFVQGQLLASLDSEVLEQRITQQRERILRLRNEFYINIMVMEVDIDILSLGHRGMLPGESNSVGVNAFDEAEAREREIEHARMELEMARQRHTNIMAQEEAQLDYLLSNRAGLNLYAPFDGVVTNVLNRAWIPSFADVIFVSPQEPLVFVEYIGAVVPRLAGAVRLQGHSDGQVFDLSRLSLSREQAAFYRNMGIAFPIRFLIEGVDELPSVGSLVMIHAYNRFAENVLRIPRNALLACPVNGFFVYVVDDDALNQVFISVNIVTDTFVAVDAGLEEGDVVYVR